MRRMGIAALYRKPFLSRRQPGHQIYPYLLRDLTISRPNQVWAADIPYIPMRRGFGYLFVVLDWASRRVLAWRLSNTLTTDFCIDAVWEAITQHGIQISMDGKGCWRDSVVVERLWRNLKYEEVYLQAYETIRVAQQGLERYLTFYNQTRPHQHLTARRRTRFTLTI